MGVAQAQASDKASAADGEAREAAELEEATRVHARERKKSARREQVAGRFAEQSPGRPLGARRRWGDPLPLSALPAQHGRVR